MVSEVNASAEASSATSMAVTALSASSGSSTPITISHLISTKLTPNNYIFWRAQLVSLLRSHLLLGYVDGTTPCPPNFITNTLSDGTTTKEINPGFQLWVQQDQSILSAILTSSSAEVSSLVVYAETSFQAWKAIENSFSSQSSARAMQIRTELNEAKKLDANITQYYNRIKSLADILASIGQPLQSAEFTTFVLRGLDSEYDSLVESVLSQNPPIQPDELYSRLLATEQRIEARRSMELLPGALQANVARFPANHNGRQGRPRLSSSRTKSPVRISSPPTGQPPRTSSGRPICQLCDGIGHKAACCFKRFKQSFLGVDNDGRFTARQIAMANQVERGQTSSYPTNPSWFMDTGATDHLTNDLSNLNVSDEYRGTERVQAANGSGMPITHIGSTSLPTLSSKSLHLKNVLHVPTVKKNLLSIRKFTTDNNVAVEFNSDGFHVKDLLTSTILLKGRCRDGLYVLDIPQSPSVFNTVRVSKAQWHARFGHPTLAITSSILHRHKLPFSPAKSAGCDACRSAKSHQLPFVQSSSVTQFPLELVYSDVWGPTQSSTYGYKYYISFIDAYSRYTWIFFLKQKSDAFQTFITFQKLAERQLDRKILQVQTDWGGEYIRLHTFFAQQGIMHRVSCPHTHQQNGTAERKHRHVVETGLTLLAHASIPFRFWTDAFQTACYLINRLPSSVIGNLSPHERLFNHAPDYTHFRTFGCACWPNLRPYCRTKLEFRSKKCTFLGYSDHHKGYLCLHIPSMRLYISRDVVFDESDFPFAKPNPNTSERLTDGSPPIASSSMPIAFPQSLSFPADNLAPRPPPSIVHSSSPNISPQIVPSIPNHSSTIPSPAHTPPLDDSAQSPPHFEPSPFPHPTLSTDSIQIHQNQTSIDVHDDAQHQARPITRSMRGITKPKIRTDGTQAWLSTCASRASADPHAEPKNFHLALRSPKWREAMDIEYQALQKNQTWKLVSPPPGKNIVDSKWVFRVKRNADGSVDRYKARLVAKGFTQRHGLDYDDTFSPVIKPTTIRILLSLAVHNNWILHQLDIQNAFLNGTLTEEVYMRQPPGFEDPQHPTHVCRLRKALYGLKQSPRMWHSRLCSVLSALGFQPSKADTSLFILHMTNLTMFLLVYVDDIIVISSSVAAVGPFLTKLRKSFAVKDLGPLNYFLGIEVVQLKHSLHLKQTRYLQELLTRANMSNCKPAPTPMSCTEKLSALEGDLLQSDEATMYRSLVGGLQYLTLTRPDIAFAVNKVCQHLHNPTSQHWNAVKRILRYLQGTPHHGLVFKQLSSNTISAFSDSDWAGSVDDRRSTGGYAIFYGNNLVAWRAKKQPTVSRSSTEAEFKALADTTAELIWIEGLLKDLKAPLVGPPVLWCDNLGATFISSNPVFHARTKHIEIDFHFVRERVANKSLQIGFVSSKHQLADVLTKPLPSPSFNECVRNLRMSSLAQIEGGC